MRWLKNVAGSFLTSLMVVVTVVSVGHTATNDPIEDSKKAANSSYGTVSGRIGSEDNLNRNAFEPLTSGTQLYTFDKSKSGTAQMVCPGSKKFVEVFIQPGSTGDIIYTVIAQDINLDGTADYTTSITQPISGVCGNGFISCTPGTWVDCAYYRWQADVAGKISVVKDDNLSNLYGCYCINSSCGSNLVWSNLPAVLGDLGGGVVGALNQALPQTAVSKSQFVSQIDGTSIIFFGQSEGGCTTQQAGSGPSDPQKYFDSPASISADASTLAASQINDSTTMYGLLMQSPAATEQIFDTRTCVIARGGSVNRQQTSVTGNGSYSGFCTDHLVYIKPKPLTDTNGNKYFKLLIVDTDPSGTNIHHNCGGANSDLVLFKPEDWHTLKDVDIPDTMDVTNAVFCITVSGSGCNPSPPNSVTTCTQFPDQAARSGLECTSSGAQSVSFSYSYSIEGITEEFSNEIYDGCTKLENDPNCTLWNEVVDGVATVDNGTPTGLTPEPICKTVAGVTKSETICDWWRKGRVYKCNPSSATYDFTEAKQRLTTIKSSVQDMGSYMQYQDMRKIDYKPESGWITESKTVQLSKRDVYENCTISCKVKHPVQDTQVSDTGTTASQRATTSSYDILYKACTTDFNGQHTCPLAPGEELVTDCTCISEFNQAATMVQFLRLAGKDLICSDDVPKPIQ